LKLATAFFGNDPFGLKMQQTKSVFMYLKGVLKFFSCMEQICDIKIKEQKYLSKFDVNLPRNE
jgi:hypothetical protein